MDIPSYKDIYAFSEYSFECPVGVWKARLDAKAWGKQRNILLFFSEMETGKKYCLSVFLPRLYRALDNGLNFRSADALPGDVFELETGKTKTGRTKFISAKKLEDATREADPPAQLDTLPVSA